MRRYALLGWVPALIISCMNPAMDLSRGSEAEAVNTGLYRQFEKWRGTPYKHGGTSKAGIDCSALIQRVFQDQFGVQLPRTVHEMLRTGRRVTRKTLKPGDIVFFKAGFFNRHAGIYLENGKFMHASSGKGVGISSLNDGYWAGRYWQSRRVLE